MTRFARAKGSKASNERKEEDATPWHIMRQQLGEQLHKNDLNEKSSFADFTTKINVSKPVEETWFEFNEFKLKKPISSKDTRTKMIGESPKTKNGNDKIGSGKINNIKVNNILSNNRLNDMQEEGLLKTNTKPHQSIYELEKRANTESKTESTSSKDTAHSSIPNAKNKSKQNKSHKEHSTLQTKQKNTMREENQGLKFNNNVHLNQKNSKINVKNTRDRLKTNKFQMLEDTNTEQEQTSLVPIESFNFETSHTNKMPKILTENISRNGSIDMLSLKAQNNKEFKKEFQSHSVKNSRSNVQTIIANGRKIEIVKFEAFWIKKEDASKLKELRTKLRGQKMPKDKLKAIIKLERRKAEKALSREKTNVCYHCRKFGHKFSDCPEINDSSMSKSGICFKCGSTEHTHFECKVTHTQNFRYAVCFVCNEQGHISRQCPLNPQGQYPKGGSCHLCGEVTHLRKDCPKSSEYKPSSFVTVEKINSVGLEDVSEMKTNDKKQSLVKNKVVLF